MSPIWPGWAAAYALDPRRAQYWKSRSWQPGGASSPSNRTNRISGWFLGSSEGRRRASSISAAVPAALSLAPTNPFGRYCVS